MQFISLTEGPDRIRSTTNILFNGYHGAFRATTV